MNPMSGLDAALLHLETAHTPMHFACLCLFDLDGGDTERFHAQAKRELRRRLHLAPVLHRRLAPVPLDLANPVWIVDDTVDLEHHVQRITLPAPGNLTQLEDCAATLHRERLDRSRPLWQVFVIDGLGDGQIGYYFKVHHAALDGQAAMLLMKTLFDPTPSPRPVARPRTLPAAAPPPATLALVAAAVGHDARKLVDLVRDLPATVRTISSVVEASRDKRRGRLGESFVIGPPTALNTPIDAERSYARVSLPMPALRELAATLGATLNDIVLALCSGALRRYLARHGGVPRKPLIAGMPMSLREAEQNDYTNRTTMPPVSLQTHIADPLRRLRAIQAAAQAVKTAIRQARDVVPLDMPSLGAPWLVRGLARLYRPTQPDERKPPIFNVLISNVQGPDMPLYLAGARLRSCWPLSIVEQCLGLNITVLSHAGDMGFGFTAARAAVPDARELTQTLIDAFDELMAAATRTGALPARGARRIALSAAIAPGADATGGSAASDEAPRAIAPSDA